MPTAASSAPIWRASDSGSVGTVCGRGIVWLDHWGYPWVSLTPFNAALC
jgi:hypothetical protein